MNRRLNNKKIIFLALFVLWLVFIFFVWRKYDADTWLRNLSFMTDGVTHFRKWLDVSGGTKLVFKISYDKYEQVYEGAELIAVKKMIENIILKNIDNRISGLWVSDYKSYVQTMDSNPYIVVEIWWIADLDQAKEIIGKTVELEFRLPNETEPTSADKAARKQLAVDLRDTIISNNAKIKSFADARWSENIYYNHLSGVTLWQLPAVYKNHPSLLTNIGIWEISEIVTDTYDVVNYTDYSGNNSTTELYGYSFYRINDIQKVDRESATVNDVVDVAKQLWYVYDSIVEKWDSAIVDTYDYVDNNLVYNLWEVAADQSAYDLRVVKLDNNILLWSTDEEIQTENNLKQETLEKIKLDILAKDTFEWASMIVDDWVSDDKIKSIIPDFVVSNDGEIQTYTESDSDYVVYVREIKTSDESLVSKLVVQNVDQEKFEKEMTSKVLYDIETVFVQDRETWKTAKSSKWDILNGAFFKYANISQSQVGLPVVAINFDDKGTEIFCDITSDNIGNQMAIFVWWDMKTSPVIRSKICGWTAQIDWNFTMDSAKELVDSLNDWALPAPLVLMQEEKINPSLWDNALNGALIAAAIGIIAIFVFMYIMYGFKKAVVTISVLISFMVMLWFFMKLVDYALSLSWIAAVILSIGMAVDANILIYERMIEEIAKGKTVDSAIETSYERSRSAIRDGNISTWLIALLLFMLWSNMFKWFGTMLMVTVLLTLLLNVPLTKTLLKAVYKNK